MKLEHVAINVSDPQAMAAWYEKNMNLKVVKHIEEASNTHFIADSSGMILLEIYNNPPGEVPSYKTMNPLLLHFGFVSENPESDKNKLLDAGASFVEELQLKDGTHLIMMRDPWGLSIQLCKRTITMLRDNG